MPCVTFFREIIAAAREIQTPLRIGFLGPEATFTHIAAMKHFGHAGVFYSQPSIKDTFAEVEKGSCHYGVVPVENSIEGSVNHTLDLFFGSELKICGEVYYHISHDLLSKSGEIDEIQIIYSHPHAFPQCRRWLRKYLPDTPHEECSSTAEAARRAGEDPKAAAIASPEAAHMYGLAAVASGIEDVARNTTRFLVIGKSRAKPTGKDKTSVMFVTRHVPGALFKALEPLYENKINMVKLESRPSGHENWSYMFFVDVEGHLLDKKITDTIEIMKKTCLYLKWLGSYPASDEGFGPNQGDFKQFSECG